MAEGLTHGGRVIDSRAQRSHGSTAADTPAEDTAEDTAVAAARRLDIMARMTRLLLDEGSLREPVALQRAAGLLSAEFADWSVIDVVRVDGLERAVVTGPEECEGVEGTRLLQDLDPRACELPREVLTVGSPRVAPVTEADAGFGVSRQGVPVLTALHAGSVLCLPLRHGQEDLGVLTLLRHRDRHPFELSDLGLIEEIAEHLSLAIRTERRYQRRSDALDALQASLLPAGLPTINGLDVGASYHAATDGIEVGGDFYDVFEGAHGWGFVLGDVCGKGEKAATVTASVRHGVRLLGLRQKDPAEVLRQVNNAMVVRRENDRFVTMVSAHLSWQPRCAVVQLVSAGHPRAALLRADGRVHFATGGGAPLGVFDDARIASEEVRLQAGDTLVLYSDGVTEARSSEGELYGDERLASVLEHSHGLPAPALVKAVEDSMYEHSAGRTHDDIALLAVRVTGVPV